MVMDRKKKDAGHSYRSDGIDIEDFITNDCPTLDEIIKNYEPDIREPSEEEKQLWKEALKDIPEINTDHITYNPDTYKQDIAKDRVEMKSIILKALREDDTVLQPLYEDAKHDSVLTYENYIHKYEVPDEEIMEILDGPDFTSINVELNLPFDQLQAFLERHLSEAAAKHENDSALEPLEDVWDQVNFENEENK